jgi:hypothetical protein
MTPDLPPARRPPIRGPFIRLGDFLASRRWFRIGRCRLCGRWTLYLLRSEGMHEDCWLELT